MNILYVKGIPLMEVFSNLFPFEKFLIYCLPVSHAYPYNQQMKPSSIMKQDNFAQT